MRGSRIWVWSVALASGAVALYLMQLAGDAPLVGPHLPWWALAAAFCAAEAFPVHLDIRRETHTISLSELGLVLALFLASSASLLVGFAVGSAVALFAIRRQPPRKGAFNVAQFALASACAVLVFREVVPAAAPLAPLGWLAAALGAATFAVVTTLLVMATISLVGDRPPLHRLPYTLAFALAGSIASTSIAIAAVELVRVDHRAVLLLAIPAGVCALAFYSYSGERRRHAHLEFLYQTVRATQGAPELRASVRELLLAARSMLAAEYAEILLFESNPAQTALRSVMTVDAEALMESVEVTPAARAAIDEVAGHDGAFLLPRTRPAHALDPYLRERLLRDAMVIALGREGRTFGLLVIANRTGDVSTFTSNDRTLFETFAGHAGVLLENDRVKEQLQYQAYHDALTGLPNRALFSERVAAAVARTDGATSVLFVDLDDFKMINDTHGHVVGDELLIAAAERIRACLRPGDVAARLGGDEFAVLLADPDDDDAAIVAGRIVDAMHASFVLHGRETRVHASIGIAAASGASTVDELLTHADVAMYAAKAAGKQQYATYEPRMHTRVRRRHEVGAALERALENDEIRVYFQPIVALADARTVAVEALVRWQHPTRGLLPPGAFLAVAEERGHIGEIGRRVLAEACACVAEWRESFEHLAVAVNLSPSELLRPRVSEDVAAALAAASLPGDALTIEITESGAMADPAAALAAMVELRSLGVRLALDDFGTGYSSLSHLRDFPIDMLKIAKPFIADLGSATPDTRFLEAILQLASALDLDVVTEGIETPAQAHLLHRLESALGQGYYFSRPLPPDEVPRQLAISAARRRGRGATVVALPAAR